MMPATALPTSRPKYDIARIKDAARGVWDCVFQDLAGIDRSSLNGLHHPCPKCGGTDRFRMLDADAGALHCNQCFSSDNGDGIAALMWYCGWTFPETLQRLSGFFHQMETESAEYESVRTGCVIANTSATATALAARELSQSTNQPDQPGKGADESDPTKETKDPARSLVTRPWSKIQSALWCETKPGVTVAALELIGATLAKHLDQFTVVALPAYGSTGLATFPVGWVLFNQTGDTLPIYHGPGKPKTYERVKVTSGSEAGLVNAHALAVLSDPERRNRVRVIWKTEGVSDCLVLQSLISLAAVANPELLETHLVVTNSDGAKGKAKSWMLDLIASCESLESFYVIHDCDKPGQAGAVGWTDHKRKFHPGWCQRAADALAAAKRTNVAVRNVLLPYPITEDHGKDLRDWANEPNADGSRRAYSQLLSLAEFGQLFAIASSPTQSNDTESSDPSETDADALIYDVDDPNRLAKAFMKEYSTPEGEQRIVSWNSEWFRYESDSYMAIGAQEIKTDLVRFTQLEFEREAERALADYKLYPPSEDEDKGPPKVRKVKRSLIDDTMQHVSALATISARIRQPSWLRNQPEGFEPRETIVTKNGIINLKNLMSGKGNYLIPPTPDYFCTSSIPFDFNEDFAEPVEWLRFLGDIWSDDPESIECLQEFMGLYLVPDTSFQKILLIVGPKRSGKGTIARIIRAMLGEMNVAGPTLAGIATNFGLWPLLGKQAAIIADARLSSQTDTAIVTERLLTISGEDGVTIDRKNLPPVTTTLPTRFILMTNELPRLSDASNALSGRFVILRMVNSFYGQEDRSLTDKLMKELPSILMWSILGWQRLIDRGYFTVPDSSQDLVTQLEDAASPVSAFLRDRCDLGKGEEFEVDKAAVFEAWKDWCESENRAHPGTSATFGVQLRAAASGISDKRSQQFGVRIQKYTGIKLKIPELTERDASTLF